jgi:hypothetical protein
MGWDVKVAMNSGKVSILEEAVLIYFKFHFLPGKTEEKYENSGCVLADLK